MFHFHAILFVSLTDERPLKVISPPGGILADEMGLGKTVEVLACIMIHRRQDLTRMQPLPVPTANTEEVKPDELYLRKCKV